MDKAVKGPKKLRDKVALFATGLVIGLVVGIAGLIFFQNYNPTDESKALDTGTVFERIVSQNELVSASQNYAIVDKVTDTNTFFDLFDIPFTQNSFWYLYKGTIKAGVNLETAEYEENGTTITITLDAPYIIANTPDMDASGALEENDNILNPIHIEDVDAFRSQCVEQSQQEAIDGGLLEEARTNAESNIRGMFTAAFGDEYTVEFNYR